MSRVQDHLDKANASIKDDSDRLVCMNYTVQVAIAYELEHIADALNKLVYLKQGSQVVNGFKDHVEPARQASRVERDQGRSDLG